MQTKRGSALRTAAPGRDETDFHRSVLSRFCSGVTIITALDAAPGAAEAVPVGFTCQSFASLSLDPPLVVFAVGHGSRSWPGIRRAGAFCANVLSTGQEALCRAFAVSGADKFAGVDWTPGPATGAPRLPGSLAWIECAIEAVHPGGDHHIVVGRIRELAAAGPSARPLLFYAADYHEPAPMRR